MDACLEMIPSPPPPLKLFRSPKANSAMFFRRIQLNKSRKNVIRKTIAMKQPRGIVGASYYVPCIVTVYTANAYYLLLTLQKPPPLLSSLFPFLFLSPDSTC